MGPIIINNKMMDINTINMRTVIETLLLSSLMIFFGISNVISSILLPLGIYLAPGTRPQRLFRILISLLKIVILYPRKSKYHVG